MNLFSRLRPRRRPRYTSQSQAPNPPYHGLPTLHQRRIHAVRFAESDGIHAPDSDPGSPRDAPVRHPHSPMSLPYPFDSPPRPPHTINPGALGHPGLPPCAAWPPAPPTSMPAWAAAEREPPWLPPIACVPHAHVVPAQAWTPPGDTPVWAPYSPLPAHAVVPPPCWPAATSAWAASPYALVASPYPMVASPCPMVASPYPMVAPPLPVHASGWATPVCTPASPFVYLA